MPKMVKMAHQSRRTAKKNTKSGQKQPKTVKNGRIMVKNGSKVNKRGQNDLEWPKVATISKMAKNG